MNKAKTSPWLIFGSIAVIGLLAIVVLSMVGIIGVKPVAQTVVNTPEGGTPVAVGCSQTPTYSYSAVDNLAGGTITGTDYIKMGTNAPVNTLANPTAGSKLEYWKSNSSYFCEVQKVDAVQCSSNSVQGKCYQSVAPTLKIYDMDNALFLTNGGGANNLTVGASETHNLKLTYQGTAYKSGMAFGGCLAVEVPNTFTAVNLAGYSACPFKWTYGVSSTGNTYYTFAIPSGFDVNGAGDLKELPFQIKSGISNPSGTAIVTFQPANYYVGSDGALHLGIEKDANSDTTKTATGTAMNVTIA